MKHWNKYLIAAGAFLVSPLVHAHDHSISTGFITGLMHPLTGLDHLAALMLAGIFIGRRVTKPGITHFTLLVALGIGVCGALLLGAQAWMEAAILASIPVFIAMQWLRKTTMVNLAIVPLGVFMVAHGWAHGVELSAISNSFITGMLFTSTIVMSLSYRVGVVIKTKSTTPSHART